MKSGFLSGRFLNVGSGRDRKEKKAPNNCGSAGRNAFSSRKKHGFPDLTEKEAAGNDPRGTNACSKAGSKSMTKKTGNPRSSFFEDLLCFHSRTLTAFVGCLAEPGFWFFHPLQDATGLDGEETESLRKERKEGRFHVVNGCSAHRWQPGIPVPRPVSSTSQRFRQISPHLAPCCT